MTRIDGVLFDFGGVVVDSPFAAFASMAGAVRAINSRDPDTNAWARLERGHIDLDEFVERFAAEGDDLGHAVDAAAVLQSLRDLPSTIDDARPEVLAAVRACRAEGRRVGLLTNNIAPMDSRPGNAWVHDEFDVVLESCVLGVRKPDPEIYPLACARLGTAPDATVLLDDLGINLKPARALGLATVKVVDPAVAMAELRALLD
ncbi:MAG TPA: HAD-IA family hydrolase [Jatrophihabitans sp.]|jgi:putative hydrolase of the HAD superfamily|uniref:HAD-IA family hydrolase n=1 Tax=Jatrophihabitans sp. TaxID=1932789 RepID=UPI002DF9FC37|nr:HAD-IA family hydrolase [Jatrophihabitans sp.]